MADEVAVPVRGALRRARLHLPATRTHGTIVFVHGSGEATVDDFAWYTDQLTDLGIACLVVDKVMDGYTQTRRHYDALADDAGDALRWARQQPDLHDAPAGLLGYSEGSWIAATAAARYPDLVDLVALCSAPLARPRSQTSYHWANLDPSRPRAVRVLRRALMWTAMTAFTDYGNFDITEALRTIPVPVILVLGADDPTVDVELACRIFDQTRHSSPPPIIVPGADHALPPDSDWINQVGVTLQQAGGNRDIIRWRNRCIGRRLDPSAVRCQPETTRLLPWRNSRVDRCLYTAAITLIRTDTEGWPSACANAKLARPIERPTDYSGVLSVIVWSCIASPVDRPTEETRSGATSLEID